MKKKTITWAVRVLCGAILCLALPVRAGDLFNKTVDADGDGICDPGKGGPWTGVCTLFNGKPDNCPTVPNSDQLDTNGNGIGDACENTSAQFKDGDCDGIADSVDLCPHTLPGCTTAVTSVTTPGIHVVHAFLLYPLPSQEPSNPDANAVASAALNAETASGGSGGSSGSGGSGGSSGTGGSGGTSNPPHCDIRYLSQTADRDGDGIGDACDPDIDGDGVLNNADCDCLNPNVKGPDANGNCSAPGALTTPPSSNPSVNPLTDTDGDGIPDDVETVLGVSDPHLADTDSDGLNDLQEINLGTNPSNADTDGDGVNDKDDNCPLVPNKDQKNSSGGTRGDACASDFDGDGVPDGKDNCPKKYNPDQLDADNNKVGDACQTYAAALTAAPSTPLNSSAAGGCGLSLVETHTSANALAFFVMTLALLAGIRFAFRPKED